MHLRRLYFYHRNWLQGAPRAPRSRIRSTAVLHRMSFALGAEMITVAFADGLAVGSRWLTHVMCDGWGACFLLLTDRLYTAHGRALRKFFFRVCRGYILKSMLSNVRVRWASECVCVGLLRSHLINRAYGVMYVMFWLRHGRQPHSTEALLNVCLIQLRAINDLLVRIVTLKRIKCMTLPLFFFVLNHWNSEDKKQNKIRRIFPISD